MDRAFRNRIAGRPTSVRLGRNLLPRGKTLPAETWRQRHRTMLTLLWLHVGGLGAYALLQGVGLLHAASEAAVISAFGVLAIAVRRTPRLASVAVSLGLVTSSAVLVHLSGGLIEAHFHFFVLIVLLTLYEDWVPFLLAGSFVLVHHGVTGMLDPSAVFNHPSAVAQPIKWAVIHALFIAAAGIAGIAAWKLNEEHRLQTQRALEHARASERGLAEAQHLARSGSFEWEPESGAVRWSRELYEILRLDPATYDPTYDGYIAFVDDRDRPAFEAAVATAVQDGEWLDRRHRAVLADGTARVFHVQGGLARDREMATLVGTCQDITERARAEAEAHRRAREREVVAELGDAALNRVDLGVLKTRAINAVKDVMRADGVAVLERGAESAAPARVAAVSTDSRSRVSVPIGGRHESFGAIRAEAARPDAFAPGDVAFLQSVAHILAAAAERHETEAEMRHLALHDVLTGLPNRALFSDRLAHALALARRQGSRVAVLFCDLDQFKLVNDSHGHAAGDELLRAVAPRIRLATRHADTVARFGGDEFAILIEHVASEGDATTVAERIQAALAHPFALRGRNHFVSATIGIAMGGGADSPESLLRDADAAMYRAKARGRGAYCLFDQAMRTRSLEHLEIENDLRRAIDEDELILHFQPVIDLARGHVTSAEALVRWRHPEKGLLPPAAFIEIAEESGLIHQLGVWVLEQACRTAAGWPAAVDGEDIGISVNLSPRQLTDPRLLAAVREALEVSAIDPSRVSLEITETAFLADDDRTAVALRALKDTGVSLALDDFGTGFSSLGSLQRFDFDVLKLDRAFIAGSPQGASAAIVGAVTAMARELGNVVVAEGIENAEQLAAARELGCHYGQGFLFSPPVPGDEIIGRFADIGLSKRLAND